jgi:hypothetical protein
LAPLTVIGISIYDMKRPYERSLVGSTTVDIFDDKLRLRQGTFNLYLWPLTKADLGLNTETPGLFDSEALKEINTLLSKIDLYQKNPTIKDNKDWIDQKSKDAI